MQIVCRLWHLTSFEALLEAFASEKDTAFYCSEGKTGALGYFVVLIALYEHDKGYAEVFAEGVYRYGNLGGAERPLGSLDAVAQTKTQVIAVIGGVDDGDGTRGATVIVDEDVTHNSEDPTLEVGVFDVFVTVVESLERCVLE